MKMLTGENLEVPSTVPESKHARRSTAVSQALKKIDAMQSEIAPHSSANVRSGDEKSKWPAIEEEISLGCRILVASDRKTRERAYALAHTVYHSAGYVSANGHGLCVSPYDATSQTLTLLSEDADGNDLATISLVFDSSEGLPCDEIYGDEVSALRHQGCRMAEVTRLAISEKCRVKKDLLLRLFNYCYIYARIVRRQSDFLIEVNPRHVGYYQRLLRFQQAGPVRPCSRVMGAPAVLLRLSLSEIESTVKESGCTKGRDLNGLRLHQYPYSKPEEHAIANYLARNHTPMCAGDMKYFGIAGGANNTSSYWMMR